MMTSTCMTPPMPMPSTSMQAASCGVDELTPISESRHMLRVITAEPAMGKNRYLPAGGPPPGQREHAD